MNRLYPPEFEAARKAGAVELMFDPSGYLDECQNCTGATGVLVTYKIERGPMDSATGGRCKYLDHPALGKGWYTGEQVYYACPVCAKDRMLDYCRLNCGLEGSDLMITLSDYKDMPGKQKAHAKVNEILSSGAAPSGFVTLHGAYGSGKTYLLKVLVNCLRMSRVVARYITLSDILAEIKDRFGDRTVRSGDIIKTYQGYKVLAVDEVDKINLTDWSRDILFQLMNARFENNNQLTILAMNMTPEQYGKQHDMGYLTSRMTGGAVIEVAGADMRKVKL